MRINPSARVGAALALLAGGVSPARAQMHMQHPVSRPEAPLGIPETRLGSGTSWVPDSSPMHASHVALGAWTLMLHGSAVLQYDRQGRARGDDQVALIDWASLARSRPPACG